MADKIVKIGSVELYNEDAFKLYQEEMYIVTYSKIYSLHYSQAQQAVYGREIYYSPGMVRRGRFHTHTAEQVNKLVGFELLNVA